MNAEFVSGILSKIPKSLYLPLILAILGTTLIGYGMIQYFTSHRPRENFDLARFSQATSSATFADSRIFVDIEGAVAKPGVYSFHQGQRVQDVLISAQGLSANADRKWVEQHLNLASLLTDAEKIYIPQKGEQVQSVQGLTTSDTLSGGIHINTATSEQLDGLVGIGQVTAQKIIAGRPYSNLNELVTKKIISQNEFLKIQSQISL